MRIQLRRGTAAAWTAANPVLAQGELGIELDTLYAKVGDGSDHWVDLAYAFGPGPAGPAGATGATGPAGPAGSAGARWWAGAADPGVGTPGADGDFWLTHSNGNVYERTSGSWTLLGNIRGPAGTGGAGSDIDGGGVVG